MHYSLEGRQMNAKRLIVVGRAIYWLNYYFLQPPRAASSVTITSNSTITFYGIEREVVSQEPDKIWSKLQAENGLYPTNIKQNKKLV
jgi:hypothetical protein